MLLRFSIITFVIYVGLSLCVGVHVDAKKKQSHGEIQIQRIIKDLPAMKYYYSNTKARKVRRSITKKDLIWTWAAKKFEGHSNTFFWSKQKPYYKASSALILPRGASDGFLTINPRSKKGKKVFEELWHDLIIELLNMDVYAEYRSIRFAAFNETLDKEGFIVENMRLQFDTFIHSLDVIEDVWGPWLGEKGTVVINKNIWHVDDPVDFQEWYELMKEESDLPEYYKAYYEERIEPVIKRKRR